MTNEEQGMDTEDEHSGRGIKILAFSSAANLNMGLA